MRNLIPDFYADKFTVAVRQNDGKRTEQHFDTLKEAEEYQEGITRAMGRLGRTSIVSPKEKASRLEYFNSHLNEEPTVSLSVGRSLGEFIIHAVLEKVERARAEGYPQDAQQYHNQILMLLREQAEQCFPVYDTSD